MTPTETGPAQPVAWQPPPPTPAPKPRRWLVLATTVWAAVLVAGALFALWRGQTATDREQTTIGAAKVSADRVIAAIVLAGDDGAAVAEVSDFTDLGECRLTVVRRGVRHERSVSFFTEPGAERALLDRIAAKLPAGYHARVIGGALPRISADAGGYVGVSGGVAGPGHLQLVADTGCRQTGGDLAERPATGEDRAPAQAALTALGAGSARWQDAELPCPDGGRLWTLRATATQAPTALALPTVLATLAAGSGVAVGPETYAFRQGPVGVVVTARGGVLTVSATGGC